MNFILIKHILLFSSIFYSHLKLCLIYSLPFLLQHLHFKQFTIFSIKIIVTRRYPFLSLQGGTYILPLATFLYNPNSSKLESFGLSLDTLYDRFAVNLYRFLDEVTTNSVPNLNQGDVPGFRILIALPDGTVFFDSSKRASRLNTYSNFISKKINENHASRIYVRNAIEKGVGIESKWSSSTKGLETYYTTRIGFVPEVTIGVLSFSHTNVN